MYKYFLKTICIVIILMGLSLFNLQIVSASNESTLVIDRKSWNADDNIINFKEDYNFPTKLIIILLDKSDISSNSVYDIRELYYYFATRSGFGDIPFHYLVTSDGKVYQGNIYGDESKVNLSNTEESIIVAYVRDGSENLSIASVEALKTICLNIANSYAISPELIEVKSLSYEFGDKLILENISFTDPSQRWMEDIASIKESILGEYSPRDIVYDVELIEVIVPSEPQEPTSKVEIKVKIKNIGDFNLYSSAGSNVYATRNEPFDEKSMFYINDEWSSFSRVALLDEGKRLVSGK